MEIPAEEVQIIRVVTQDTVALRLSTGAVVCAHVQPMPLGVHDTHPSHPLWAQARLGPYSVKKNLFTDCDLTIQPLSRPPNTTQFQPVSLEW
jgi:hypothetical protein